MDPTTRSENLSEDPSKSEHLDPSGFRDLNTNRKASRDAERCVHSNVDSEKNEPSDGIQNNGLIDQDDTDGRGGNPDYSRITGKETRIVIIIAVAYLCIFTSFRAIQNLQSSLNDEGGLGVVSLSVLYAAATVSAILAPLLVTKFGVKRVVIGAFVVHSVYTASNFYPSFGTLVPSSFLLGMITGPLWTSQGIYIATCAYSWASRTGGRVQKQLGLYNGIFWSILDFSGIIGSLVTSLVLHQGSYNLTNTNVSSFCGPNDCPGAETEGIIADPEPVIVYTLLGIFLGCVFTGIILTSCCLHPVQPNTNRVSTSIKALLKSGFQLIPQTDMKFLIPFIVYTSVGEQFIAAEITKSFISCPIGIQNVGYVLIAYGISRSLTGVLTGRLSKYIERYVQVTVACGILIALHIWMLLWVPGGESTVLIYVLCSVYGATNSIILIQLHSVMGEMFSQHLSVVFAVNSSIKSIGYTATFVYSSFLCTRVKLAIALACLCLALVMYLYTEYRYARRKRNNDQKDRNEVIEEPLTNTEEHV